jgi:hypothetical protein
MNLTTLGGRKFILSIGCGIVSSLLLWFGKLDANNYTMLIGFTIGAYITGGTIDNLKSMTKEEL